MRSSTRSAPNWRRTRPTAVNLFWAIDRMKRVYGDVRASAATKQIRDRLIAEAKLVREEDIEINRRSAGTARRWCPMARPC